MKNSTIVILSSLISGLIMICLFIAILFMFTSCGQPKQEVKHEDVETVMVERGKLSVNPAFYLGSDFGNFFQVLYRQEKYDVMLQHTSLESVKEHGVDKVTDFYRDMQFAHRIKLDNMNQTSDSTYTMNYVINQMATRKMWRLKVKIVNDSIKVVLPDNLENFLK